MSRHGRDAVSSSWRRSTEPLEVEQVSSAPEQEAEQQEERVPGDGVPGEQDRAPANGLPVSAPEGVPRPPC